MGMGMGSFKEGVASPGGGHGFSATAPAPSPGGMSSTGLTIAPPGVDDLDVDGSGSDEDEDDARPLTLHEVERSVMRRMQYKATKGARKSIAREKREREKSSSVNRGRRSYGLETI